MLKTSVEGAQLLVLLAGLPRGQFVVLVRALPPNACLVAFFADLAWYIVRVKKNVAECKNLPIRQTLKMRRPSPSRNCVRPEKKFCASSAVADYGMLACVS